MVAGRFIVRDRRIVTVDVEAVYARARGAAEALWSADGADAGPAPPLGAPTGLC